MKICFKDLSQSITTCIMELDLYNIDFFDALIDNIFFLVYLIACLFVVAALR